MITADFIKIEGHENFTSHGPIKKMKGETYGQY